MTLKEFYTKARAAIPPEVNMTGIDVKAEYNGREYEYSVYVWSGGLMNRALKSGEGRTPEEAIAETLRSLGYAKPQPDMVIA